jgi:hypothetical protein
MKLRHSEVALILGVIALVSAHWLLRGSTSWWTGLPFSLILCVCMAVARMEGLAVGRQSRSADRHAK